MGGSLQETLKANPYVYADNDPVNEVDPSGKMSLTTACLLDAGGVVITSAIALALAVSSGGLSLIVTSLALYGQGAIEVGGLSIGAGLLSGCLSGASTQLLADIASSIGLD